MSDPTYGVLATIDQQTGHILAERRVDMDAEGYLDLVAGGSAQ